MDIHTVRDVMRPASHAEVGAWRAGQAWLAGGTWLFSEPQIHTDMLIDLHALGWADIEIGDDGLDVAATCPIIRLDRLALPEAWHAAPLLRECSHALLMSFKIANVATVGGNICMSLPAGAMISLTVALEATYRLLARDGSARDVAAVDFVTGNNTNILAPGELLRSIHIRAAALSKRFAFRRASLHHLGRSAVLVIGTLGEAGEFRLTITASTPHPYQLSFSAIPDAAVLREAVDAAIPAGGYFDDVNGTPAYRRHLTSHFAEEIRAELAAAGASA